MKRMMLVSLGCWATALVVWALGWTNSLSALSLTAPAGESLEVALLKAMIVLSAWFGAVMVAPVLMLTASTRKLVSVLSQHSGGRTKPPRGRR